MLPLRNNERKFGWVAQLFHWVMAIVILGMLGIGLYMVTLPNGLDKLKLYGLHKSTGVLILFFLIFRFLWRQVNYQPHVPHENGRGIIYPPKIYKLMDFFAHYWHLAVYVLLLIMPITGWLMTSSFGFPVSVYGLFTLPDLVSPNHDNAELFETIHDFTSYTLIFFIFVHIFAGLFHHFVLKDIVMKRMLPVILLVFACANAEAAQPVRYDIDLAKSSIKFEATQNGAPASGEFRGYKAKIAFGTGNLADSKAVVEVDTTSVASTYDEMASTLKGDEWFNVKKFPMAKFETTKFVYIDGKVPDDGGNYMISGNLTIKDKTVPVGFSFKLKNLPPLKAGDDYAKAIIADGEATISRKAFGIGWADVAAVKDEVKIVVHIEAQAADTTPSPHAAKQK